MRSTKEQEKKAKESPQGVHKKRVKIDLEGLRWRPKPRKLLGISCELDGTQAPWDLGEGGVSRLSQLGHNPNLDWDSPRDPVPMGSPKGPPYN